MDFKRERVRAHNRWPDKIFFKAEEIFNARLEEFGVDQLFTPLQISESDDRDYQLCVGHLIDGLEALPLRPDYLLDHAIKVIELAGTSLAPNGGIRGVMEKLGTALLALDRPNWEKIIDELTGAMPVYLYELMARRVLQIATKPQTGPIKGLRGRAEHAFGKPFYDAFICKYTLDSHGALITTADEDNKKPASRLLKLYMSGRQGTRATPSTPSQLDLSDARNVPSYERRIECILSILLFTIRNERAHGSVISPFRSSKARIERYENYYFLTLLAYVFASGAMALKYHTVISSDVLSCCRTNISQQRSFFTC
ncbi:hypothetical protein ACC676_08535 [Rhizobium ruizarguesonis]